MKNKEYNFILLLLVLLLFILLIFVSINFNNIPLYYSIGLYDNNFWESFLINFHNSLIDIAIFGLLLIGINSYYDKKNEYNNCISGLRLNCNNKNNDSINLKNIELINKLYLIKKTRKLNLTQLNLKSIRLFGYDLEGSIFNDSIIDFMFAKKTNFDFANFRSNFFNKVNLIDCSFKNCNLKSIKCDSSDFRGSRLINCNLQKASLINSSFKGVSFKGSNLNLVNYCNSDFSDANFLNCININVIELLKSKNIYKAKFDSNIILEIENIKGENYILNNNLRRQNPTTL